jgi:class 3 adenylate cyclase
MAAAEHMARKGEVVLDEEVAAVLGERVRVTEWRDAEADSAEEAGRRYAVVAGLAQPVSPAPWPPIPTGALSDASLRPWLLPAVYERLRSGQGEFLAELRPAVTLFLRFGGIDYDGDEGAGTALDAFIRTVQLILERYGGHLLQMTVGDKGSYLYASFGAPIAYDDAADRAVAAALDLRDLPPPGAAGTGIQIGISRGRMRVGAYGGATRRTYGVLGDEVNMSARLMSAAAPGQIVVSQVVAGAVARQFELQPLGSITVEGKRDPVSVAAVLGRRPPAAQTAGGHDAAPLVGRDAEVARLAETLEVAGAGAGQILRVEGSPGVGKSHLAAALVNLAAERGFRVAQGASQSIAQDTA